jgi:hypothetical protein
MGMGKIWQADGMRNHLSAVREGIRASLPLALTSDSDGRIAAYNNGCEAAIKCLAERFGVHLDPGQPPRKSQTGELKLKTWTREEVKHHLGVAWRMMHPRTSLVPEQNPQLTAYYQGIDDTLQYVAESFGIEGFALMGSNGASG